MKNTDRFLVSKFPEGWQHFHFTDVIFKPALMTPAELAQVVTESYDRLFTMSYLRFSFLRTWWNTRNLRTAVWAWNSNLNYRSIAREKHICSDYSQNSE
ncbi:MAG: hypothetical protein A2X09_12370 [Bacteroidetes bacterium GWF2_43_11]|nr:MAG: hypothetical protein A2X09_12370 [Bacteroidetes bacterium GWF2_43_11]